MTACNDNDPNYTLFLHEFKISYWLADCGKFLKGIGR